ncbi:DUF3841 domain-containing protein [Roseburia hominis]
MENRRMDAIKQEELKNRAFSNGDGDNGSGETVILWTRQVPEVWEELKSTGIYRVKPEYIRKKNDSMAEYYLDLYRWYTKEARKYLELSEELEYPIWLCVDEENMLQPTEDTVILKVEVPRENVIICNMDAWGYRVNYWYIPLEKEDEKRHRLEFQKYGIGEEDTLISTDKGNFYPLLKKKITDSWSRVFTLLPEKREGFTATMWELRREWIKEVRFYGSEGSYHIVDVAEPAGH